MNKEQADALTLEELRAKVKDGTVKEISMWNLERILSRLFRSKEFSDYWLSYIKVSKEEMHAAVDTFNPNPDKPVAFYCVAGGAVGNLMYAYLTETVPVVNDVDIFCWAKGERDQPAKGQYYASPKRFFSGIVREGNLNIIYQEDSELPDPGLMSYEYKKLKFEELLQSFDYNIVMAYWSPNQKNDFVFAKPFSFFVQDPLLKIFNFLNPLSTIIRGIQKSEQLKLRFEKNKVIEVMAHLFGELNIEESHLGEKKKSEARNNPNLLEPWFKFDSEKQVFVSQVQKPTFNSYTNNKSRVFAFFRLSPWQREQILYLCDNNFFAFSNMFHLVTNCQVNIPQYNKQKVAKYANFMRQHSNILIHPNKINEWLPFIKKCSKIRDKGLIGFIESSIINQRFNATTNMEEDYHKSFFKKEMSPPDFNELKLSYEKQVKEEFSIMLTEALPIPQQFAPHITELVSKGALKMEGLELDHCVGGYFYVVQNNRSRIFKVRYKDEKATLELGLNPQYKQPNEWALTKQEPVWIKQFKGIKNIDVSEELKKLASEFIKAITPEIEKSFENMPKKEREDLRW